MYKDIDVEFRNLRFHKNSGLREAAAYREHNSLLPRFRSCPVSSCSCLNVHQLSGHGGLGVFALKMLLEGLGVRHLCLKKKNHGFRLFDLVVTN